MATAKADRALVTPEHLRELVSYNSDTGRLVWKVARSWIKAGSIAGNPSGHGYLRFMYEGRKFMCHRVAWALHYGEWPRGVIDHINGDGTDNRIANLREATRSQNNMNRHKVRAASGYKGVAKNNSGSTYQAIIGLNRRRVHLGNFATAEEAAGAYDTAAIRHFGDFAKTNASLGLLPDTDRFSAPEVKSVHSAEVTDV